MSAIYFPSDEFTGVVPPNFDLAADYLELKAVFSDEGQAFSADIVDASELAADADFSDVNEEMQKREEVAAGAIARMASRKQVLAAAYPFELDPRGDEIVFTANNLDLGQAAYLVSLLLSNLRSLSPLLDATGLHPSNDEVRQLRLYFQYFATSAIAAEIRGSAWSFGFPRPDSTGFIEKLSEVWAVLKDGTVAPDPSAPAAPKDDQVDVFAWREQPDGLPGFLLVAAQVATGKDWRDKSIKQHVRGVFEKRWFNRPPVTEMVAYHVIPFARPDELFRDDVLVLGNVLHRLRLPRRVSEAAHLVQDGASIEAFDQLDSAVDWIGSYVNQARVR